MKNSVYESNSFMRIAFKMFPISFFILLFLHQLHSQSPCYFVPIIEPNVNSGWSYNGGCENIVFTVEPGWVQDTQEGHVRITIERNTPLTVVDSGDFIAQNFYYSNGNYKGTHFSIHFTYSGNMGIKSLILSDPDGIQDAYVRYEVKCAGDSSFELINLFNMSSHSGPIVSGSLQEIIDAFKLSEPFTSCSPGNNQKCIVDGNLDIDVPNYCFQGQGSSQSGSARIMMLPGSTLTVKSGNTLNLIHNYVVACDGQRWNSIIVEPGATLIANNTTFDNGHFAITALQGSSVFVSDCHFKDAYVGIYGSDSENEGPALVNVVGDCSFTFDNSFNAAYPDEEAWAGGKPLAGIKVEKCNIVSVMNNGIKSPLFENLQYGILLKNSNLTVSKARFFNMTSGIPQYGMWGGGVGIASRSDNQDNIIRVTGFGKNSTTNFNNLTFGIVNRGNKLSFVSNKMTNI